MSRQERVAAGLSVLAGILHSWAGPAHTAEWWVYGLFFYGAATVQAGYGLLLWTRGIEGWGGWPKVRGKVYLLGVVGNVAIVVLWALTRTVGVPLGPEAGEVEPIGLLDATSKSVEAALIGLLVWMWRDARAGRGAQAERTK